ncbi:MAG: DUF929 family protein, partial [Acidimicrobiales bacterium]
MIIVLISTVGGGGKGPAAAGQGISSRAAPASIVNGLANVPASKFAEAGLGGSGVTFLASRGPVVALKGKSPLTLGGKPLVLYLGAQFCPFCAATRWPLVIALDRFGSFSGLKLSASSPVDFAPNTRTLDIAQATYHSRYLAFEETEQTTNTCHDVVSNPDPPPKYACVSTADYGRLQTADALTQRLISAYDTATYFSGPEPGGIPFVDMGNRFIESGAPFYSTATQNPPISLAGYSWAQIVASLQAPIAGSPGQAILGAANHYVAAFCQMTGGKPGSVCNQSFV